MSVNIAKTRRHPWLDKLIASPFDEVLAMAKGTAAIPPFQRSEPSDAAATLLYGLTPDDQAVKAFDQGALTALSYLRTATQSGEKDQRDLAAIAALNLLTTIQRLAPHHTSIDLHCRFSDWNSWVDSMSFDKGLDLRREYWRALALTQYEAALSGLSPRRLLPFWLEICSEAGDNGRYDDSYLSVGLLGLRSLPLLNDDDAIEAACVHGLINWAYAQQPPKTRFLREWHLLKSALHRDQSFWSDLIPRVMASAMNDLVRKAYGVVAEFPAADWLRNDTDENRSISPALG